MRGVPVSITRHEREVAERVVQKHVLPEGVRRFSVEPGEDHDGDPTMYIWLDLDDPTRRDEAHVAGLSAYMREVRNDLFENLDEYRPHFRMRAA